jgi:hypothetical protein
MLDAIGGGLIGIGALLLLSTLWWPPPPLEMVGDAEHRRTKRNSAVATIISAAATFAGAVLLLLRNDFLWALLGVGLGLVVYHAMLASWTHREWAAIRRQVTLERQGGDGRITLGTASRMGETNDPAALTSSMAAWLTNDAEYGEHAARVAARNAQWRWALRHPRGGGWDRLNL